MFQATVFIDRISEKNTAGLLRYTIFEEGYHKNNNINIIPNT